MLLNFIEETVACDKQGISTVLHEREFFNIREWIKYMYVKRWCIPQLHLYNSFTCV